MDALALQKLNAADFPRLLTVQRRRSQVLDAIGALAGGLASAKISNVELGRIRTELSSLVESAWESQVMEPFLYSGRYQSLSESDRAFLDGFRVYGLHDVLAAHRKLESSRVNSPVAVVVRQVLDEAIVLARAARDLKQFVVKRNQLPTATKPLDNPNKIVRTCACCFRDIAVVSSRNMAHHGYARPAPGFQTSSCPGIGFPPLEVSSAGLTWLAASIKNTRASLVKEKDKLPKITQITTPARAGHKCVVVNIGDPGWDKAKAHRLAQITSGIATIDAQLPYLQDKLSQWRQTETSPGQPVLSGKQRPPGGKP